MEKPKEEEQNQEHQLSTPLHCSGQGSPLVLLQLSGNHRTPRRIRGRKRCHSSLLMLAEHPGRYLEGASRYYANPIPCSFPSPFPWGTPLGLSRH